MLRIRLARFGRRNLPFYRIFVADSKWRRDGKHLDNLGYVDPFPAADGNKHVGINFQKMKYWLSVGAQPSDPVARLLGRIGLIPTPPMPPKYLKPEPPLKK